MRKKKSIEELTEDLLVEIMAERSIKNPDKPIEKVKNEVMKEWNELIEKVKGRHISENERNK